MKRRALECSARPTDSLSDTTGVGNHQSRNSCAVARVVERLNVAGVVITAALFEGDDDGGAPRSAIHAKGCADGEALAGFRKEKGMWTGEFLLR